MTPFFAGLATGFLLGAIAFGIFAIVLLTFKRPAPPPTKFRRKYRDAVVEVPPPWEGEPVEPIYMYGVTGLEDV